MMYFSPAELSQYLGISRQAVSKRLKDTPKRKRNKRGGGYEYHISSLPPETQAYLKAQNNDKRTRITLNSDDRWRKENLGTSQGTGYECQRNGKDIRSPNPQPSLDGEENQKVYECSDTGRSGESELLHLRVPDDVYPRQLKEKENNVHGTRTSDSISLAGWRNRIKNAARDGGIDTNNQGINETHPETESGGEFCNANQRCTTIQDRTHYSENSLEADGQYPTNQNPNPACIEPNTANFSRNRTSNGLPASESFDTNFDGIGKRETDRVSQRDLLILPNSRRVVGLANSKPTPEANESAELGVKEARLYLLGKLREFAKINGLGKCAARYEFSRLYNLNELQCPKWVRVHIGSLSPSTLVNWTNQARADVTQLDNRYGNRKGTGLIDRYPELQFTIQAFSDKPPRHIRTKIEERNPDAPLPSVMQIRRWLKKYIAENQPEHDRLTDPNRFHSRSRMAMGSYSESVTYALERIESDATKGDVFLTVDGEKYERYSIVGIIDVFSRREKYFVVKNNNARFMVQSVLRWMLQNWGWLPPEGDKPRMNLVVDNGKEFIATEFQEACVNQFGIQIERCQGKSPWQKPFIERSFRTMGDLLEQLPGFCGHNVSDRQKIRAQLGDNDVAAMLHPQDLQKLLDSWVSKEYECRKHRGEGLDGKYTPLEKWATTPYEIDYRYAEDNSTLDLLLAPVASRKGIRTVQGNGIEIDKEFYYPKPDSGQLVTWHKWMGRKVLCKFDPVEPYTIHCYSYEPSNSTKTSEYLFTAYDFRNLGWNRKFLAAEAHRTQSQSLSNVREMKAVRREEFGKILPFNPRRQKKQGEETLAEQEVRKIQERDKIPEPVPLTPQQEVLKQKISDQMAERQDESSQQRFYRLYLAQLNGETLSPEEEERVQRCLLNNLHLGARARAEQDHALKQGGKQGGEQTRK